MKVRLTYLEWSERVAVVDAESIEQAQQLWIARDDAFVDLLCDVNVEIDAGMDWTSASFALEDE